MSNIQTAVNAAGGARALAAALTEATQHRVATSSVYAWMSGTRRIPAECCPVIERLTGVRCEWIRPDVEWGVLRSTACHSILRQAGQGV